MNDHVRRRLFALGAMAIAGGSLAWVSSTTMSEDLVYYWTPQQLLEKGDAAEGATVRIMGQVEPASVVWEPDSQRLAFRITDGAKSVAVEGKGAPPQMFREGIGVVVEGKLHADGVFRSNTVMVKHDNEYRPPEEGERPEDIYQSLVEEGS